MIIFAAMIVPFIIALVLWAFFRHATKWWEFLIPFGASLIIGLLIKVIVGLSLCHDIEYWTGWITQVNYYEDWKETVIYTEIETYTGADGKTHTRTVTKTRTDYHPPYWQALESNGHSFGISQEEYIRLARLFGNETYQDLGRWYCCGDDGDMYYSQWNGDAETMQVATTAHSYENRVIASNSIFNFQEITAKQAREYGLYDYPDADNWYRPSVLGDGGPTTSQGNRQLDIWNANLGAMKQVRIWILIFNNQSLDVAYLQENYWKGSNKNELVLCIGVDSGCRVQWGHVFSWTEREDLKVSLRNYVNGMQGEALDLPRIVGWIGPNVHQHWERKDWSKFDYLSVEPPTWTVVLTFCLTLLINLGISAWLVSNEYTDGDPLSFKYFWTEKSLQSLGLKWRTKAPYGGRSRSW